MSVEIKAGPGIHYPSDSWDIKAEKASLRILTAYDPGLDQMFTRLDVWIGKDQDQFNISMPSVFAERFIPTQGIIGAWAAKLSAKQLSEALRGLADKIDEHAR